jgi:hypothetical protein
MDDSKHIRFRDGLAFGVVVPARFTEREPRRQTPNRHDLRSGGNAGGPAKKIALRLTLLRSSQMSLIGLRLKGRHRFQRLYHHLALRWGRGKYQIG